MRTTTTSSIWYNLGLDRVLHCQEYLFLLGYDSMCTGDLKFAQVKDLAGEAMSLPCLAEVLFALLVCADIKEGGHQAQAQALWERPCAVSGLIKGAASLSTTPATGFSMTVNKLFDADWTGVTDSE